MDEESIVEKINSYDRWRHKIEVAPGIFTPGQRDPRSKLKNLPLPENLDGKRVLDIGAADGFFTFEAERRGASEVVAMDIRAPAGFSIARELLDSKAEFVQGSVYDLPPNLGEFDLVMFIDVIYHLPDPTTALKNIRKICAGELVLSTVRIDDEQPIMHFMPAVAEYRWGGNFWSMSPSCLRECLSFCDFHPEEVCSYADRVAARASAVDSKPASDSDRISAWTKNI